MKKTLYLIGCLAIAVGASSWLWTTKAVVGVPTLPNTDAVMEENTRLRTLAANADLIVAGKCLATQSRWVENNRILVTVATVEVDETLKGGERSSIDVVLPGGSDANRKFPVAMTYPGAPSMQEGEEVFLFLNADDLVPGGFSVTGFNQGKFSIVEDDSGEKVISNSLVQGRAARSAGGGPRSLETLSGFKQMVKAYVGQ